MITFQNIEPIRPLQSDMVQGADSGQERSQPTMFADIFRSMVDNVKETDAAKNEAYYALSTGQLDNPAQASIASAQALLATQLLVQMRNRALDAYSELMRINM